MNQLDGKTVVIIGGTEGIGLAAALAAQQAGAIVWAASRSEDKVKQATKDHEGISFRSVDIHDSDAINSLLSEAGSVDHLVAAATGANRTIAPFMNQTDEQFRAAFDKFWGYTNLVRTGVPHLSETGSVTFVSGIPARKCNPAMSSISCVGNAVEGLARALALELAPIRVNVVAPGTINTAMFNHFGDGKEQRIEAMGKNILLGRVGEPDEIAEAILLCMNNRYMTGATIDVDGGALLP